jgi:hypothetical protein
MPRRRDNSAAKYLSRVNNPCSDSRTALHVTALTCLSPVNSRVEQLNSGPVVRCVGGRSPRVVLKAAAQHCANGALYSAESRAASHTYRIARSILEFVIAGDADPVGAAYALHDELTRRYGTGIYEPRIGVVADLRTAANLKTTQAIARGEILPHSPKIPTQVDGRTAAQWRASVVAYLEWRISATTTTRVERLASPYHAALREVLNPQAAAVAKASTVAAVFPQQSKIQIMEKARA